MILTFEVQGDCLDVHFDKEGREALLAELTALDKPDHTHMSRNLVGNNLTTGRYDKLGTPMEMVTLYHLDSDTPKIEDDDLTWLYDQLFEAGCIKFGEFKLKSGITSPVYCDFRVLVSKPMLLQAVGVQLARKLDGLKFNRIAALPYAGMPIGVAASIASGRPMIYPRKEAKDYGTAKLIEGKFEAGETAVIIDDVITDGGAKLEAIKPMKEAGLEVKDVVIILDREQGGKKILADAGYTLHSIMTLTEVLDGLVRLGRIEPSVRDETLQFIAANQFGTGG